MAKLLVDANWRVLVLWILGGAMVAGIVVEGLLITNLLLAQGKLLKQQHDQEVNIARIQQALLLPKITSNTRTAEQLLARLQADEAKLNQVAADPDPTPTGSVGNAIQVQPPAPPAPPTCKGKKCK